MSYKTLRRKSLRRKSLRRKTLRRKSLRCKTLRRKSSKSRQMRGGWGPCQKYKDKLKKIEEEYAGYVARVDQNLQQYKDKLKKTEEEYAEYETRVNQHLRQESIGTNEPGSVIKRASLVGTIKRGPNMTVKKYVMSKNSILSQEANAPKSMRKYQTVKDRLSAINKSVGNIYASSLAEGPIDRVDTRAVRVGQNDTWTLEGDLSYGDPSHTSRV